MVKPAMPHTKRQDSRGTGVGHPWAPESARPWISQLLTCGEPVATGKACIRNLRFPVSRLLGLLASGETRESILKSYPYLEAADIDEALRYAAYLSEDETIELAR